MFVSTIEEFLGVLDVSLGPTNTLVINILDSRMFMTRVLSGDCIGVFSSYTW